LCIKQKLIKPDTVAVSVVKVKLKFNTLQAHNTQVVPLKVLNIGFRERDAEVRIFSQLMVVHAH